MILKKGDENIEVANWQRFLISQGHDLEADGDFGEATAKATRAFQASQGLRADGIVGDMTLKAANALKSQAIGSIKVDTKPPLPAIQNFAKIHPNLAQRAINLLELAHEDGYSLRILQGFRSFEEQDALFKKRPKVTNARGGQSMHNYGLAVDFVFIVNGKVSWDEKLYKNIGRWAEKAGLEWGGNWKFVDMPHVQLKNLPGYKTLRPIYDAGGLKAVWEKYRG
jgi:peptidoglycan L-alanyl-D-glutamate endopeptidase CwlK